MSQWIGDLEHTEALAKKLIKENPNGGMYHSPQFILQLVERAKRVDTLFDKIRHGDEAHQEWLKKKL